MKIWIIILSIAYILLLIISKGIANYISNDKEEVLKYKILDGASTLGIWFSCTALLSTLVGFADLVLIIIVVVEKFL